MPARSSVKDTLPPPIDLWLHERVLREEGRCIVAGVDEAGRGPLAGPVVAAAAVLPEEFDLKGITDSKKLSPAAREQAYERLCADEKVVWAVGIVDAADIDRLNILRATHHAMRLAVTALRLPPDAILVDGLPVANLHPECCRALVKGDSLSASVAAASIIAKVTRDRLMCGPYHELYPAYDFARHKGYPTPEHLAALAEHGPCLIHRRSFGPVAQTAMRFGSRDTS